MTVEVKLTVTVAVNLTFIRCYTHVYKGRLMIPYILYFRYSSCPRNVRSIYLLLFKTV